MSNKELFDQITYVYCPKGADHLGEPLSRVCVDTKCTSKELICAICQEYQHKGHSTMPLKYFLKIISNEKNVSASQTNPLFFVSEIQKYRKLSISSIRLKRRELEQKFNELERKVLTYFDNLQDLAKNVLHSQGPINQVIQELVYGTDIDAEKLSKKFKEILKVVELDEDKKFSLQQKLEGLIDLVTQKERKITNTFATLDNQITKNFQTLNLIFSQKLAFVTKQAQFFWSPTLKGAKIKITDLVAQQTSMESNGQRFILMQPQLGTGLKKRTWGVKIKKFAGWIGVGISLKNILKTANYNFNYTVMGHGSYLISTNGYCWSHSIKQFNSAFKCFQFTVNDTVYIEFDPAANKLRFRKNDSLEAKDKFQLDIDPTPIGDNYHPSANLCSTNDTVQIIYPGKPLS